jgi:hypothetical protein
MTSQREAVRSARRHAALAVFAVALALSAAASALAQRTTAEAFDVSASDGVWTVLTMAPDGNWGAATESMSNRAIANAVADCQFKYGAEIGCGGYILEFQRGWVLGIRCGNENILAAARELAEAERLALWRERQLRSIYRPNLPPCGRVVTIDPRGAVKAASGVAR